MTGVGLGDDIGGERWKWTRLYHIHDESLRLKYKIMRRSFLGITALSQDARPPTLSGFGSVHESSENLRVSSPQYKYEGFPIASRGRLGRHPSADRRGSDVLFKVGPKPFREVV